LWAFFVETNLKTFQVGREQARPIQAKRLQREDVPKKPLFEEKSMLVNVTPQGTTAAEKMLTAVSDGNKQIMNAIRAKRAGIIAICITLAAYIASVVAAISFTGEAFVGLAVFCIFFFLCGPLYGTSKKIFTRCLSLGMWPTVCLIFGLAAVSFFSMNNGDLLWRVSVTFMAILGGFGFLGNMASQDEKDQMVLEIAKQNVSDVKEVEIAIEAASAK